MQLQNSHIAVVIPCYRVAGEILSLLPRIGNEVRSIFVIDDCCPERSGHLVKETCHDPRVRVIFHSENQGVGGAVMTGFRAALEAGAEVVVKIDGDGQMAPELIPLFVSPILSGRCDYAKGNRFFSPEFLGGMPPLRIAGNAALSFISKAASGYWNLMDPTNGYIAIHSAVLAMLPFEKIQKRYFFESDILFRLNTLRAVVSEIPLRSVYGTAKSNMRIGKIILEFPPLYAVRFVKRIIYNYFLRDFNICSLQILVGTLLFVLGVLYGSVHWYESYLHQQFAPTGTIMVSALMVMLGFQLLLAAVSYDTMNIPKEALHEKIRLSGEFQS